MRRRALVDALGLAARSAPAALAMLVLVTGLGAVVPVALAWFTKLLFDRLAGTGPSLTVVVAGLMAAGIVGTVLPHVAQYLTGMIGRTTSLAAQDRLYRTVNGFAGLGRFEDPEFLDRLRMAQQCGQATPGQILTTALGLFRTTVTLVGFAFSLLLISPPIAGLVLLGGIPTLVGELRLAGARVRTTVDVSRLERREVFYGMLLANVQAAKEIRLFRLGDHFRSRMTRDRTSINGLLLRMDRRTLLTQGGLAVLAAVLAAVGLLWAVRGAAAGTLSIGDVSVFVAAVAAVQAGAGALAIGLAVCHEHLLVYGHYRDVVRVGPDLPQVPGTLEPLRRGIQLDDVWFRYSDDHPWILRGVTLTIPCGRSLALVGVNGAGKSTLVKLLCRFYDPSRGTIQWDGVDIRQVPVDDLRARMSAIFQDFMRYDVTAAENIGLGDLAVADTGALVAAARLAGIDETLSALPNGYDTMLTRLFTEHADPAGTGVVLSGGQWQRVALARALVRDRRDLLIMDEPSSGLDAEAEYEIHARLREHAVGQTTVLITHRLGAVRDADAIAVLHDGVVAEHGDHYTLMAADGQYARLFALQAEGYVVR